MRPYYLYNGNSNSDKTASLYWDASLDPNLAISVPIEVSPSCGAMPSAGTLFMRKQLLTIP